MNYLVDAILIIIVILGALNGIRQGFIKSVFGFFGSVLVFFLAWVLKTSLANILIKVLPQIGGNSAISVIIYYILSFIILLVVFSIILEVVLKVTNIIEKLMNATIVLGAVSKVLGGIFGAVKTYLIMFIVLFILSTFNFSFLANSKVNKFVLDKTPLLGPVVKDVWESIRIVYDSNDVEGTLRHLFEKNIINEENLNRLLNKEE